MTTLREYGIPVSKLWRTVCISQQVPDNDQIQDIPKEWPTFLTDLNWDKSAVIAGGYAAKIAGNTSDYNDIDCYIQSSVFDRSGGIKYVRSKLGKTYRIWKYNHDDNPYYTLPGIVRDADTTYPIKNIINLKKKASSQPFTKDSGTKYQLIVVGYNKEADQFEFGLDVLMSFDLPPCQVALIPHVCEDNTTLMLHWYSTQGWAPTTLTRTPHQHCQNYRCMNPDYDRLYKYKSRLTKNFNAVPLLLICYRAIVTVSNHAHKQQKGQLLIEDHLNKLHL